MMWNYLQKKSTHIPFKYTGSSSDNKSMYRSSTDKNDCQKG